MQFAAIKHLFIFLLLQQFCLDFSQTSENHGRYKRRFDETTTAEPKIGNNSHVNTAYVTNVTNSSTISKIPENRATTTAYTGSGSTGTGVGSTGTTVPNLYMRLSTMNVRHTTSTTTAMPISNVARSTPIIEQRQFDILSFIGGCLFTFCLVGIAIAVWKLYEVHVERSYRTI